jgi:hypothetical protein
MHFIFPNADIFAFDIKGINTEAREEDAVNTGD